MGEADDARLTPRSGEIPSLSIDLVKEELVDWLLVVTACLGTVGIVGSLARLVAGAAWQPLFGLHIGFGLALWTAVWLRRFIPLVVRAAMPSGVLFVAGIAGLGTYGLASGAPALFTVSIVLVGAVLGVRWGVLVAGLSAVVLAALGLAFSFGWLALRVDMNAYATAGSSWVTMTAGLLMCAGLALACLHRLHGLRSRANRIVRQRTRELMRTNRRLELEARERARAEESLRTSEARYRQLFEIAAEAIVVLDTETGRFADFNRNAVELFGTTPEHLATLGPIDLSPETQPDGRASEEVARECVERAAAGETVVFEWLHQDLEGRRIHCEIRLVRLPSPDRLLVRGSIHDISARKRAEAALRAVVEGTAGAASGEEFFQALVRHLAEALSVRYAMVTTLEGPARARSQTLAVWAGDGFGEGFAYDLAGTPCHEVATSGACHYPSGVAERFPRDTLLRDMGVESYLGTPIRDAAGEALGLLIVLDTKPMPDARIARSLLTVFAARAGAELMRARAYERLAASEDRYRTLVQNLRVGVFRAAPGAGAGFEFANPALVEMLGASSFGDVRDGGIAGRIVGREPRRLLDEVLQTGGSVADFELELARLDGSTFWGSVTLVTATDEDGRPTHVDGILHDVTERKQLQQADKLRSLGTLVAGVAHEINNPNNFVKMNASILRDVWADVAPRLDRQLEDEGGFEVGGLPWEEARDDVPKLIAGMSEGAERIAGIVRDLKDYAREDGGDGGTGLVDLNEVVRAALNLLASPIKKATSRLVVRASGELPPVRGSFRRLEQVLVNLVQNACESLESPDAAIEIETGLDAAAGQLRLVVRDEGEGIPEPARARVLDPFFTTKRDKGGTGLGLSVSARIVKEHGGTLDLSSRSPRGTAVTVTLPVAEAELA